MKPYSPLLRQAVINYASGYGRYGYRAIADLLRMDGKVFRVLVVIDEYSRECLALHVARNIRSEQVVHVLADLFLRMAHRTISAPTTARSLSPWR